MASIYIQRAHNYHYDKGLATPEFRRSISSSSSLSSSSPSLRAPLFGSESPVQRFSTSTPTASTSRLISRRLSPRAPAKSNSKLVCCACAIPHASKQSNGEDAHFTSDSAMGVADGVGGWAEFGVDAGLYSRRLMQKAKDDVHRSGEKDPMTVLRRAFNEMDGTVGTTTACVITLDGARLRAVNLGDSGFVVLRYCNTSGIESTEADIMLNPSWRVVLRSQKQQHRFNCPFQIGTDSIEHPCDADVYDFTCERDDLIISATDGVFDNLFEEQITEIVSRRFPNAMALRRCSDLRQAAQSLSSDIANEALRLSHDESAETPFSVEAKENRVEYNGGKQDDITVVVGIVQLDDSNFSTSLSSEEEAEDQSTPRSSALAGQFRTKLSLLLDDENSPNPFNPRKRERNSTSSSESFSSGISPRQRSDSW